jgi:hypothetical protein
MNRRTYSSSYQTGGVVAEAHEGHGSSPSNPATVSAFKVNIRGKGELHNTRDEDTGFEAFQEDIRQGLEKRVGDKEHGQCHIVQASGKRVSMRAKIVLETINPRVTYVGTIEKRTQVQ